MKARHALSPLMVGGTTLLLVGMAAVYFWTFHYYTTAHLASISPDGLFRCELREKANGAQAYTDIWLHRQTGGWTEVYHRNYYNDSASWAPYSIHWQSDHDGHTASVNIHSLTNKDHVYAELKRDAADNQWK